MICPNCSHDQVVGNYCSGCGNYLLRHQREAVKESVIATSIPSVAAKDHLATLKNYARQYSSYFIRQLKSPSHAFSKGEGDYSNAVVSILLFVALFCISIYLFTINQHWSNPPSFLSSFTEMYFVTIILVVIAVLSIFFINTIFGPQHSFKSIISFYGGQLPILLIGATLSLILMFLKSFSFGNGILTICLILAILFIPLYIISAILTSKQESFEPLYGFLLYIVLFFMLMLMITMMIGNLTINSYVQNLTYLLK
ncbi:Yip1 family protein [Psychrobacillus sp. NPDC093200]|uniref:Yip1 family protein n=1 Tax=Psychrobacillus sp. NPDC093200 TaxID=3390656 RepID=UPI0011A2C159|nr:hypothetical protein GI482_12410 [Bacillus sp. N3536]